MADLDAIIADARRAVASGQDVDAAAVETLIRDADAGTAAKRRARQQLARVLSVHRARALVAREAPVPPAPPVPVAAAPPRMPRRAVLKTRPAISGNMDLGREGGGEAVVLTWKPEPRVVSWEIRVAEREERGVSHVDRDSLSLPGEATRTEVRFGERPLRVHVLGRARDGRLLRRAVVSGLAADNWDERWQRRASAS